MSTCEVYVDIRMRVNVQQVDASPQRQPYEWQYAPAGGELRRLSRADEKANNLAMSKVGTSNRTSRRAPKGGDSDMVVDLVQSDGQLAPTTMVQDIVNAVYKTIECIPDQQVLQDIVEDETLSGCLYLITGEKK